MTRLLILGTGNMANTHAIAFKAIPAWNWSPALMSARSGLTRFQRSTG